MEKSVSVFAERLKLIRKEKGLTAYQLGKKTGISESAIRKYENSESAPSHEIIFKLCTYLNISSDYLIGLGNNKGISPTARECARIIDTMRPGVQEWSLLIIEALKEKTDALKRHQKLISAEFINNLDN
ncbi:MAG: helix-turn-helix transcriptional regulator [Cyclobacteriaceae bacterium]|nr:helix-turn-helix transcriptional regulator [Cyclobacteriaceae bacterium]